jgi:putative ABC transport system permease protein
LPYSIVGVIPSWFAAKPDAEVWIPLQADPHSINQGHFLQIAARLRPGVSISQAQAEMRAVGERFRHLYPKYMDKIESVAVIPMRQSIVGNIRKTLYVLFGAVAFVLLIACANVANLLLARSGGRHRELAIRAALGASRRRVIRQLLTENVLLSTVGGFLGLLLGVLGVHTLLLLIPGDIPRVDPAQLRNPFEFLNWRILVFTIGVSLLTAILFGLIPALQISKPAEPSSSARRMPGSTSQMKTRSAGRLTLGKGSAPPMPITRGERSSGLWVIPVRPDSLAAKSPSCTYLRRNNRRA